MLSLDLLEEANTPLYKPCHSVPRYCFFLVHFQMICSLLQSFNTCNLPGLCPFLRFG